MQRSRRIKGLLLILTLVIGANTMAQQINCMDDIRTIHDKLSVKPADPYKRPYIYKNERSVWKKINPVNVLFGSTLYIYQNGLSKHISADCLYNPSCSEFGKEAFRNYGFFKGMLLTADRLNRCNRIAATDLRHYTPDPISIRYSDPVTKYK